MNFLSPLFLAGLGALAVPVLIHLINRERKVAIQFPSLMFLHKIPYKSVRRQKLRHILLLILRCLALAIIVSAFARPFLDRKRAVTPPGVGAREVVIAVDRSYSMGYGGRWKRAQDAARDVIRGLSANDRATVILFDTEPVAASEPTADKARLEVAISNAKIGSQATRYPPAIKLAGQILGASTLPRRELVLVSDFQLVGWAKREEVTLPQGSTLTPVDVGASNSPDAAVISVSTDRSTDTSRARLAVTARLTNVAAKERTTDAVLEIGGRPAETRRVTIPAKGALQIAFTPVAVPSGATRGLVRIGADSLVADDSFHFTIAEDDAISVLIVNPPSARSNQSFFLRSALAIVDRPKFKVDVKYSGSLAPADLVGRSLIIFNEAAPPSGTLGARVRELVRSGVGLLIVPGNEAVERWPAEWRDSLPARIGPMVDRSGNAGATIAAVDYSSPIFEIFSAPRSGDFSTVRVLRYRTLTARGDSGVIARYDDGAPAMVQRAFGAGRIVIWGTTLDNEWTDLPIQPVFLPFATQLGKHVGRYTDAKASFTAGEVLDLSRHAEIAGAVLGRGTRPAGDSGEVVLQAPSGERTRLSISGTNHLAPLKESGFYELRSPSTPVGGGRPIAVNVDPAEADLSHLEPQELVLAATSATGTKGDGGLADAGTAEERERKQTLWWYLLLAALLLLAVETVMSNRLSRVVSI
jgi:hypothetical protein